MTPNPSRSTPIESALIRALLRAPVVVIAVLFWASSYGIINIVSWLGGRSTLISNLVIAAPMVVTGVLLTLGIGRADEFIRPRGLWLRIPLLAIAIFTAAIVQVGVDRASTLFFAHTLFPDWQQIISVLDTARLRFVIYIYCIKFAFCLAIIGLVRALASIEQAATRAAEMQAAYSRAEAAALRLQLNPHFLFNALNSIASTVGSGEQDAADEMIGQLADFLRASIAADPMADVALSEEMATVRAYLAIEQARFGARLSVDFRCAPEVAAARVPNFILQPLIENAVKHGVARHRGAGSIHVEAAREDDLLAIAVTNVMKDLRSSPDAHRGLDGARPGIGLSNVRQRLAILHDPRARLETLPLDNGYRATLLLPYRAEDRTAGHEFSKTSEVGAGTTRSEIVTAASFRT